MSRERASRERGGAVGGHGAVAGTGAGEVHLRFGVGREGLDLLMPQVD